jgi:hypothetical protein
MFGGKRYGEARVAACPFCGASAYAKNKDGVPVCASHKNSTMGEIQCACGSWLSMREGKWGPFFTCEKCGIVNMTKALEMQKMQQDKKAASAAPAALEKKHTLNNPRAQAYLDNYGKDKWVRSDDPRFEFK